MKSLEELKDAVLQFAAERDWEQFHTPKNLSTAVAVEAAELQELLMWLTPEQSRSPSPELLEKIEDEVGDVLICLVNFAARTGIDPLAAAAQKIIKNQHKYPIGASRGRAAKYDEL
jgi:dCTP diphosphatase